jgi:hypothetical protein
MYRISAHILDKENFIMNKEKIQTAVTYTKKNAEKRKERMQEYLRKYEEHVNKQKEIEEFEIL